MNDARKINESYHFFAITAVLCWSLAYVLTRLALRQFSAYSLGCLRYIIASGALAAFALATGMKRPARRDLPWFALGGFSGFFIYMITFNKGCETVSSATASVIIAAAPIATAPLARLAFGEKLAGMQWAGMFIAFVGVVILTMMDGTFTANAGIFWLLGSTAALSAYNLLQRRLTKTYTGLQAASFCVFAGTAMLALFLPRGVAEAASASAAQLVIVAVLGVFSSAVGYLAWSCAFTKANNTSSVSNYMFVTPFTASLMGFLLAGEIPGMSTIAGGAFILTGLAVFNRGGKLREPPTAATRR